MNSDEARGGSVREEAEEKEKEGHGSVKVKKDEEDHLVLSLPKTFQEPLICMSKSKTLSSGTSPGEQLGGTSSCSVSTHPCSSHCWPATNKAPGVASSCLCPWGVL